MTNNEKYAYIAGFLDSDGCITFGLGRKTKKDWVYIPVVCFYNRHMESLKWIQKIIGGSIYSKPRHSKNHGLAQQLYLRNQTEIFNFLPYVIPYMIIKKEKAQLLYKYMVSRRNRGWANHKHLPANRFELNCIKKVREISMITSTHAKSIEESKLTSKKNVT